MDKVYVIMTELNGYKNLEPHPMAYATREDAEAVAGAHRQDGRFDHVGVLELPVIGDGYPLL